MIFGGTLSNDSKRYGQLMALEVLLDGIRYLDGILSSLIFADSIYISSVYVQM